MSNEIEPRLITAPEVAKMLNVTPKWVYDHITRIEPIIPHVRISSRRVRFEADQVEAWWASLREARPIWERPGWKPRR